MPSPDASGDAEPGDPVPKVSAPETTEPMSVPSSRSDQGSTSGGLSPRDAATVQALPAGNALLVVQHGPDAGSRFLLDATEVTAGRHPDSDIFLDDVTVSRHHAVFYRRADGYHLKDVGSLNGTYLNEDRIEAEPLLSGHDEVQIGKYRLVFFPSTTL